MAPEMRLSAQIETLSTFLRLGRFEPASVQREFQWDEDQARRLFTDLLEFLRPLGFRPATLAAAAAEVETDLEFEPDDLADGSVDEKAPAAQSPADGRAERRDPAQALGKTAQTVRVERAAPEQYFLGMIVLKPSAQGASFEIYDGFQRTTTLLALFSALREAFAAPASPVADISGVLMSDQPAGRRRLFAPRTDRVLARILGPLEGDPVRSAGRRPSRAAERLFRVFSFFRDSFSGWPTADLEAFYTLVMERVVVAVTQVESRSIAYQMFVGANARGRHLEMGDVLKGKMIEMIDRAEGAEIAERYAEVWTDMRRTLKNAFDRLLRACEFLRYLDPTPRNTGDLWLQEIEQAEARPDFDPAVLSQEIKQWIDDVQSIYLPAFQRLRAHFHFETSFGGDVALRRLSFLGWDEWLPVALTIDLLIDDRRRRARHLFALQRFGYILTLVDWDEGGRREAAARAVTQLREDRSPLQVNLLPDGSKEYGAFALSRSLKQKAFARVSGPLAAAEIRGPIVRLLETLYWERELARGCTDDADVEHVLPQALKDGWEHDFTEDEHEYWRHRLGNLCLLQKKENEKLQTKPWPKKQRVYLRLADAHRTAGDVATYDTWTPADVAARHARVVDLLAQELGLKPRRPQA